MSGGVGIGERKAMEEIAERFNLKLVFAVMSGQYLSNIFVKIYKNGRD
jgi:hypothetical protein